MGADDQPSVRRRLIGLIVAAAIVLSGQVPALGLVGPPSQTDGSTTSTAPPSGGGSITTTSNLLNGPTTAAPAASTTSSTKPASGQGNATEQAADDTRTVWYIVAGLVAVAAAIGILTFLYWRRTRPNRSVVVDEDDG